MAKGDRLPFSKTELKILVYNRVKRGVPYEQAVEQIKEEIAQVQKTHYEADKEKEKAKIKNFKEEFDKLKQ